MNLHVGLPIIPIYYPAQQAPLMWWDDLQRASGSEFEFQGDFCAQASLKDMP
jgi:hypothetical protein